MSTTFTMRLEEEQKELIAKYAQVQGISMTDFILSSTLEKIEDAIDLQLFEQAMKEYEENPVSYSVSEAKEKLGLV